MLPLRLVLKNFLAYRSPDVLIFDGIHLACLTGSNGAGKSSLLDAITWALWGEARAKRDEDLVHLGQQDMEVQLDFEQEGAVYRVRRQRTRRSGGQGRLELFIVDGDGALETRSEATMRATQQKINALLRLDYETFVNSAFLQQGKADAFTTKTPAQRKKILSDILGLARWEAYEEAVRQHIHALGDQLAGVKAVMGEIDAELAREPQLQQTLEDAAAAETAALAAADAADASLREVEHAPSERDHALTRQQEVNARLASDEAVLRRTNDEIARLTARLEEHEAVIAARAEIEQGYAALQQARERDHDLGDKLMQLNAFDRQREALVLLLRGEASKLEADIRECETTLRDLERTIAAVDPDEVARLQVEVLKLGTLEGERDAAQSDMSALDAERAELKGGNDKLRAEMTDLKDRIERLKVATGAACPLCGQPLTEDHRLTLVAELEADGKQMGDTFRANTTRIREMETDVATLRRQVEQHTGELRRLAGLREKTASLTTLLDAANAARLESGAVAARLDALRQTLATNAYAPELRAQIAALDAERAALGYDTAAHNSARQQVQTYRDYEDRHGRLKAAQDALPDARAAHDDARARRDEAQERLDRARADADALIAEIARLEALVKEFHAREQASRIARKQYNQARDAFVEARQALGALAAQRTRRTDKLRERDTLDAERTLHEVLRQAFGRNGIPAMIIETAIPELEVGANTILARMTDGRMSLQLKTQREKVTGGVAETLDIEIADELGTRPYELYSGGEAFRINFAIRVALSQLLARRAGAHLRTLFIDEGFGTQDEDGRNKLIEAITAIQDDFDLILAITHIEELRDAFPVHIQIDKQGSDGSRISVR